LGKKNKLKITTLIISALIIFSTVNVYAIDPEITITSPDDDSEHWASDEITFSAYVDNLDWSHTLRYKKYAADSWTTLGYMEDDFEYIVDAIDLPLQTWNRMTVQVVTFGDQLVTEETSDYYIDIDYSIDIVSPLQNKYHNFDQQNMRVRLNVHKSDSIATYIYDPGDEEYELCRTDITGYTGFDNDHDVWVPYTWLYDYAEVASEDMCYTTFKLKVVNSYDGLTDEDILYFHALWTEATFRIDLYKYYTGSGGIESELEIYWKVSWENEESPTAYRLNQYYTYTVRYYWHEDFYNHSYDDWELGQQAWIKTYEDDWPGGYGPEDEYMHTFKFYISSTYNPTQTYYYLQNNVNGVYLDRTDSYDGICWQVTRGESWGDYFREVKFYVDLYMN